MDLTARPQHQVPVDVEHLNRGVGLVEFLQTLYQFGVVIHVDGRDGGLQQRQGLYGDGCEGGT